MFSIGEFSRITGLSVKTLRLYHEKGLLEPAFVDEETGYRYFTEHSVEKARVIVQLRAMEFSLKDIRAILEGHDDEADILDYLERQKEALEGRIRSQKSIVTSLGQIISREKEAEMTVQNCGFEPEEKTVDTMLIAGVRMKGDYCECGKGFALIGKRMGRHICGKPFNLYYDGEYREGDADFEACMPVRKGQSGDGISVRELPGGKCVSLIHKGPYDELGRSYEKVLAAVSEKGYTGLLPSREVYIKGPGMIFKGNPKKYITEIQIMVE